jgi:hypothetical protein
MIQRGLSNGVVEIGAVLMDDSAFNAMQVATVPLTLLGEITEPTQVILTEVTLNLADRRPYGYHFGLVQGEPGSNLAIVMNN